MAYMRYSNNAPRVDHATHLSEAEMGGTLGAILHPQGIKINKTITVPIKSGFTSQVSV